MRITRHVWHLQNLTEHNEYWAKAHRRIEQESLNKIKDSFYTTRLTLNKMDISMGNYFLPFWYCYGQKTIVNQMAKRTKDKGGAFHLPLWKQLLLTRNNFLKLVEHKKMLSINKWKRDISRKMTQFNVTLDSIGRNTRSREHDIKQCDIAQKIIHRLIHLSVNITARQLDASSFLDP
jgi:hypothetical protein